MLQPKESCRHIALGDEEPKEPFKTKLLPWFTAGFVHFVLFFFPLYGGGGLRVAMPEHANNIEETLEVRCEQSVMK